MSDLKHTAFSIFKWLRKFYTGTLVFWLVWIVFLDNNNLAVVWANRVKMKALEKEKEVLLQKIEQKKKERSEVFGNPKLLEKWAREKYLMRRPTEDVYVIVDENNKPVETSETE
jgi:cell division protein DivIC